MVILICIVFYQSCSNKIYIQNLKYKRVYRKLVKRGKLTLLPPSIPCFLVSKYEASELIIDGMGYIVKNGPEILTEPVKLNEIKDGLEFS